MTFRKSKFWSLLLAYLFFLSALGMPPLVHVQDANAAKGLLPYPKFKAYVSGTSTPLAGGKLYTYLPGTTTPTTTYTTAAGTVANANPVVLDSNGEADVWFTGVIKLVLTDSADVTIWTKDNIGVFDNVSVTGNITGDGTGTISGFSWVNITVVDNSVTPAKLYNVSGTPSSTTFYWGDNTWRGVTDNSVTPAKLQYTGTAPDNTAYYRGDGVWSTPASDAMADNSVTPAKHYSTSGTPDNTTFYRGDGTWKKGMGYTLQAQSTTYDPIDGTTVYFGAFATTPTATNAISKIYIPVAGTITYTRIYSYASNTTGSNEAWLMYLRLNDSTDTLIDNVAAAASSRVFENIGMSVAVAQGDYVEIKVVNPTWATNPKSVFFSGVIYIE